MMLIFVSGLTRFQLLHHSSIAAALRILALFWPLLSNFKFSRGYGTVPTAAYYMHKSLQYFSWIRYYYKFTLNISLCLWCHKVGTKLWMAIFVALCFANANVKLIMENAKRVLEWQGSVMTIRKVVQNIFVGIDNFTKKRLKNQHQFHYII